MLWEVRSGLEPLNRFVLLTSLSSFAVSLAAFVHSIIGNVGSGSLFAGLQSAGAGGAGLAIMSAMVQVFGVALFLDSVLAWLRAKSC